MWLQSTWKAQAINKDYNCDNGVHGSAQLLCTLAVTCGNSTTYTSTRKSTNTSDPPNLSLSLSFCCALGQGPRAARPSRLHHCYTILIERLGCIRKQKLRHAKAQVGRVLAFQRLSLSLPSFLQAKVRENGPAPRRPFPSFVYEKKGFGLRRDYRPFGRGSECLAGTQTNPAGKHASRPRPHAH